MKKKTYRKPKLQSRRIELGVFGNYKIADGSHRDGGIQPLPIDDMPNRHFHME